MPDKGSNFSLLVLQDSPCLSWIIFFYLKTPVLPAVLILLANLIKINANFIRLRELEDQLQGLEATKPPAAPELKFKVCNGTYLVYIEQKLEFFFLCTMPDCSRIYVR